MKWPSAFVLLMLAPIGVGAQPSPLDAIGVEQRLDAQLPLELDFVDSTGDTVKLGDLFGDRPVVLVPVYYECPMLCGEVLRGLVGALRSLGLDVGVDFDVVVVSFDPGEGPALAARKRTEILKRYGDRGEPDGWSFLTGREPAIAELLETIGFHYGYDPARDEFAHASLVVLATPDGRVARYFFGIDFPPRDLRLGLVEASQFEIGGPVDQFLLYCYHYDPTTGKYGLVIMNVLRIAGLATVVLLGGFLLLSFREDRRKEV